MMHDMTLQLKFTRHAQRPECARFIPSENPREWLDELIAWSIPLRNVKLCSLPRSRSDNSCAGVLAIYESSQSPRTTGRTQAYGRIAASVYLPVEAALNFEPTAPEWEGLLSSDVGITVWHPHLGLVTFESNEVLTVTDLISRPALAPNAGLAREIASDDWGFARTGTRFSNRITALRADLPPSFETMLADGRDGIGTQAKPPPTDGVVTGSLKSIGTIGAVAAIAPLALLGGLISAVASKVSGLNANRPQAKSGEGLAKKFVNWLKRWFPSGKNKPASAAAQPPVQSVSPPIGGGLMAAAYQGLNDFMQWTADLFDARKREINRLMKLLEENPDEGLKFALPMGGEPGRGTAAPSTSLLQRMVDFSLTNRGGGGPADVWDLPPQTQLELSRRYRDLAAREIQLGRYRRAAYIFAELLGDINAAANALVTGRFYREAAVLYRDKLKRPLDAANCLEKGGLLQEAIPLFRDAGQLEKVGDLYLRLDEPEHAEEAFREALGKSLEREDFLDSARILEVKLKSEDEALEVLDRGWPIYKQSRLYSKQSRQCLESSFDMRTRLGRHAENLQRIDELRKSHLEPARCLDAVEVLANTATQSPHAKSRSTAADAVRVMVSQALTTAVSNRHQLVAVVARLAPEDRLLSRDCHRATQRIGVKQNRATNAKKGPQTANLVRIIQLPHGIKWSVACEAGTSVYAAGWCEPSNSTVCVVQTTWNDKEYKTETITSELPGIVVPPGLVMCSGIFHRTVILGSSTGRIFKKDGFPSSNHRGDESLVSILPWLPRPVSAIASSPSNVVYTFEQMSLLWKMHDQQGHSVVIGIPDPQELGQTFDPYEIFPIVAQEDACYLAIHGFLCESRPGKNLVNPSYSSGTVRQNFSQSIRRLVAAPPHTETRLAVLFDRGAYLYWNKEGLNQYQWFGDDLQSPQAVFLRDGRLIVLGEAADKRVWRVCTTTDHTVKTVLEVPCDFTSEVIALLRASAPGEIGVVTDDGKVRVYQF